MPTDPFAAQPSVDSELYEIDVDPNVIVRE